MTISQDAFTAAMLDPGAAVPAGLTNPDGAPATKRFNVYRNNVAVSLTEALETAFPVIAKLLGAENFKKLAAVFLRQHPPSSPVLMFYGAEMPSFLATFPPVQSLPYLPDVARLELAMRQSYHAADADPITPKDLQALPGERLMAARLRLAPAVHLIRSRHPVQQIWAYNMQPGAPKPQPGGQNVLVTRPEFEPQLAALPPGGGTFVAALVDGATFGAALEAAQAQLPDFDLTPTLGLLLAGGAITDVKEA